MKDLEKIQNLQRENLAVKLSKDEIQSEGFVTLVHSLEVLEQLHSLSPSVIIKDEDELAAYALVMTKEARQLVPALEPMFQLLDNLYYHNRLIKDYNYYVMGQICIAKPLRGKGLFDKLYQKHRELFKDTYDFVVTEIATRNSRSLRA
ncbi:MAG: GNAT family N-acetyltransferase, partial [Chitinophagaceae bacterium]